MSNYNDIKDDEFRIIGSKDKGAFNRIPPQRSDGPDNPQNNKRKWTVPLLLAAVVLLLLGGMIYFFGLRKSSPEYGVYEIGETPPSPPVKKEIRLLGHPTDSLSYTEQIDTVINDIPLTILLPHNAIPELSVGRPDKKDESIILITQAADIRGDNKKILGSFVLKGEPLAWGKSKHGFCAIIDSTMTVGIAEDSPLFEKAIDADGYFFRQFGLVDHGKLIEHELKNKAYRRALCNRQGQQFICISGTQESFHDFAQALIDLDVETAISLVGSLYAYGWHIDRTGTFHELGADVHKYKNESYLLWRKKILEKF